MFPSLTHIAVTVTDLERSVAWYRALFGSAPVLDEDVADGGFHHTVFAIGGGQLFGLHKHTSGGNDGFQEVRAGLDHIAFGCANREELVHWAARLEELRVEHGGVVDAHYGSGLSFRDPDNIALEFFAPPA